MQLFIGAVLVIGGSIALIVIYPVLLIILLILFGLILIGLDESMKWIKYIFKEKLWDLYY